MLVKHQFTVHAICPFIADRVVWDYYTVTVELTAVVDVHAIERVMDGVRGKRLSQEDIAELIARCLKIFVTGVLTVDGRHSANSRTVVKVDL